MLKTERLSFRIEPSDKIRGFLQQNQTKQFYIGIIFEGRASSPDGIENLDSDSGLCLLFHEDKAFELLNVLTDWCDILLESKAREEEKLRKELRKKPKRGTSREESL